jgi:predicted DNA-binding protein (UPF0251 family)
MAPLVQQELSSLLNDSVSSFSSCEESTSCPNEETTNSKLQWGQVHVREYVRVVGDHPDVRLGPPLSIGWEYCECPGQSLDEFESERSSKRKGVHRLSSSERKDMLHNVFQVPIHEARAVLKDLEKIRRHRQKTKKQGIVGQTMQSAVESAKRKLQRTIIRSSALQRRTWGLVVNPAIRAIQ